MKEQNVVQGDAFEELSSLADDSAHAAVIDYPWKFAEEDGTGYFGNEGTNDREFEAFQTESHTRLMEVVRELERVLVSGSWVFVFADDDVYPEFREIVDESPLERRRTLVWDRCTIGMGIYFRSRHTLIIPATVGETDRKVKDRGTVIEAVRQDGFLRENDYPTSKPVDLYRKMLAPPVLHEGERLLEPFCGSAPGAKAAAERGLGYWGVDVNSEAVNQAKDAFSQQRLGQTTLPDGGDRSAGTEDEQ